ncbi:hypothetical protein [Paraconexibacter sp. AEG42_29]|uniref:hypothetical protein n=1 Tax=Paraconexibacter sp. AEG42_29 TaxID=2997339 RepID=UPI00339D4626
MAGDVRAASMTARAFVEDYLLWTRGQRAPSRIAGASGDVRRELVALRLRPSRGTRRGRPQITELRTDLTSPTAGRATARVIDRVLGAQYTLRLDLARGTDGWEVTDVSA